MLTPDQETQLLAAADRVEIAELMGRYCYYMDTRDWPAYRACWTDRMSSDAVTLGGLDSIATDDWIYAQQAFWTAISRSQHVKSLVEVIPDADNIAATVISVLQGKHWDAAASGDPLSSVVGYYRDRVVRTPDGWKIHKLTLAVHWHEGNGLILARGRRRLIAALRERYPAGTWPPDSD